MKFEIEAALIILYKEFTKTTGVPLASADEHFTDERLSDEQRAWLRIYVALWDASEEAAP